MKTLIRYTANISLAILSPIIVFGLLEFGTRPFWAKRVETYFDQQTYAVLGKPVPKKAPDEYRVFIYGSSAAYGFPVADRFSIAAWLRKSFPLLLKDKKVKVMNCAWPGKASHHVLQGARSVMKYQPDLFIIYSGNNEALPSNRIYADMSIHRLKMDLYYGSTFYRYIALRFDRLRKHLTYGRSGYAEKQYREEVIASKVYKTPAVPPDYYVRLVDRYRKNMKKILATAKRHHVKVLFMTVPTNIHDYKPEMSIHRDGLSAEALASWEKAFKEGHDAQTRGDYNIALSRYLEAEKIDSDYADLQFNLGAVYEKLNSYARAKQAYFKAQDTDAMSTRAKTSINKTIRELASSSGSLLLDTVSLFESLSPYGIISSKLIYDNVHPTVEAQQIISDALLHVLFENDTIAPKNNWDWPAYENSKADPNNDEWKVDGSLNAYQYVLKGLAYWNQKRYPDAVDHLQKGLEMMPSFLESYAFLADAYTHLGEKEKAVQAFRTLNEKNPALSDFLQQKYPEVKESYSSLSLTGGQPKAGKAA